MVLYRIQRGTELMMAIFSALLNLIGLEKEENNDIVI